MKMIHAGKMILLSTLLATTSQLSYAISMSSISDAISNNTSIENFKSSDTKKTASAQTEEAASTSNNDKNTLKNRDAEHKNISSINPALFIEDAAITGYIHSQLLLKRNIPSVNVTTENAVVSLRGTVDTKEQADTLVKIASSVKGVKFVNTDELNVKENGKHEAN